MIGPRLSFAPVELGWVPTEAGGGAHGRRRSGGAYGADAELAGDSGHDPDGLASLLGDLVTSHDDSRSDPELAVEATRHPLLRAWGRDSREMQLVLAGRLAGVTSIERHHPLPEIQPSTLLQRLQVAIRADAPPTSTDLERPMLAADDRSVQIHACHGRGRQAEVVREAITHLLAADPTLEPRDIVVLCPDIDEMAPLIHAAFGGAPAQGHGPEPGLPSIPYRLADRSLRQTNPVLGAMAEVLALIDSRVTASQVLALVALTPVHQRFDLDDDDVERVGGWIEAAGIRWGLDAVHRDAYDLGAVDTGTWNLGLVRLLLGVTMSEDDHRLVGGALPLDDVDSGDIELAGRFAELVRRLGHVVRDLSPPRPIAAWVDAIDRAADLLMDTRPDDAWQRSQLDELLGDVLVEAGERAQRSLLRLAEVRDLLADRLRGQPTRAAFRTGDLTMCTLVPMRSVPHRVICIVGLDDGAFPRGGAPDGDDILGRARHVGDHDRRSEDRQLLLDAVLAAGDALVITYAGRDVRTNEVLPPAVPVNELLDVIDATVSTADGSAARSQVVRQHPLLASDRRCFVSGALGSSGPWSFEPLMLAGAHAAAGPPTPPHAARSRWGAGRAKSDPADSYMLVTISGPTAIDSGGFGPWTRQLASCRHWCVCGTTTSRRGLPPPTNSLRCWRRIGPAPTPSSLALPPTSLWPSSPTTRRLKRQHDWGRDASRWCAAATPTVAAAHPTNSSNDFVMLRSRQWVSTPLVLVGATSPASSTSSSQI